MDIADFHRYMSGLQSTYNFPIHVSRRLHAFLGDAEDPVFADLSLTKEGRRGLSGRVVVFTTRLVLSAHLQGSPNGEVLEGPLSSSVLVEVWSRHGLVGLSMQADEVELSNSDREWTREYESYWPRGARVTLEYRERDPLVLPLAEPGETVAKTLRAHLHSLASDLDPVGP